MMDHLPVDYLGSISFPPMEFERILSNEILIKSLHRPVGAPKYNSISVYSINVLFMEKKLKVYDTSCADFLPLGRNVNFHRPLLIDLCRALTLIQEGKEYLFKFVVSCNPPGEDFKRAGAGGT